MSEFFKIDPGRLIKPIPIAFPRGPLRLSGALRPKLKGFLKEKARELIAHAMENAAQTVAAPPLVSKTVFMILRDLEKEVKKALVKITEADLEYYEETVIDYFGDDEEWLEALDRLTREQILKLYELVRKWVSDLLEKNMGREFESEEKKRAWIVEQLDALREEIKQDPKKFLEKSQGQ